MKNKGLYIHIPFCKKMCSFCSFFKITTSKESYFEDFTNNILEDIEKLIEEKHFFKTIYIGGGTPNYLPLKYMEKILKKLSYFKPNEFSIELNSEHINKNYLLLLKRYGVNRASVGIQTFDKKGIKLLNRFHTKKIVFKNVKLIKEMLTKNVSLDLIFNYPGQKFKSFKRDLNLILKLKPTHISAYDLIIEDKTRIKYLIDKKIIEEPSSDNGFKFFSYLIKKLKRNKFGHYEISSFAKDNFKSIHNQLYWKMNDYIGIGPGAVSFINNTEIENEGKINNFNKIKNKLNKDDLIKRHLLMGLRLLEGVKIENINKLYNIELLNYFKKINDLINDKLLLIENNVLKLSEKGIFLGNLVFEVFV